MPYWYGADMHACFEVQDGASDFAVTQKVHITGNLGKREVSHTAVVTALEQARLFEWRFSDRYGVKGSERWELEPTGAPSPERPPKRTPTLNRFFSGVIEVFSRPFSVISEKRGLVERMFFLAF